MEAFESNPNCLTPPATKGIRNIIIHARASYDELLNLLQASQKGELLRSLCYTLVLLKTPYANQRCPGRLNNLSPCTECVRLGIECLAAQVRHPPWYKVGHIHIARLLPFIRL